MRLTEIDYNSVLAEYYCDICGKRIHDIPVEDSIYNGCPYCNVCNNKMTLRKMFLKL